MRNWKATNFLPLLITLFIMSVLTACVGDPSASKRRGTVKDYSTATDAGCGSQYLKYIAPYDTCTTACATATSTEGGYHLATSTELTTIKNTLTTAANTSLLSVVTNSAGVCVPDTTSNVRPTDAIEVNADFCSCIGGKSDIINNCDSFCANKANTDQAMLYVNTTPGTAVTGNTKLGNLHNWCTVQLTDDTQTPGCVLNATDEFSNTMNLAMTTTAGSNSFTANITNLTKNRTWILKVVETKTGTNAQTKSFQVNRKEQTDATDVTAALQISPVNQYTCLQYGYTISGTVASRDAFARRFYYYTADEMPAAMPPVATGSLATTVCHDETINPGNDNITYNRLENYPGAISIWSKNDAHFTLFNSKPKINTTIQTRLSNEYNITSTMDLFKTFNFPTSPSASSGVFLGWVMVPFKNTSTGKTYCPTSTEYNGTEPLFKILGDYLDDTEGLYIAEKEAEIITQGTESKTIYGTILVRQTTLMNYGFYVENGLKIKIDSSTLHTKTVYFYWPTSTTADPLIQGTRRLFTVKTPSSLLGGTTTAPTSTESTTDKRLGCIPKTN